MDPQLIMLSVVDALERLDVPYIVVGSFSSNAYGIPRSTYDADFVVESFNLDVGALARLLAPNLILDRQLQFETITGTTRYIASHASADFVVELFLLSDDEHHLERFKRRCRVRFHDREIWLPTPEDVIIQKLKWYLRAKRSKDIDDARDVLAVQMGKLDLGYLRSWCDRHGTRSLLDTLFASLAGI